MSIYDDTLGPMLISWEFLSEQLLFLAMQCLQLIISGIVKAITSETTHKKTFL